VKIRNGVENLNPDDGVQYRHADTVSTEIDNQVLVRPWRERILKWSPVCNAGFEVQECTRRPQLNIGQILPSSYNAGILLDHALVA